jgi:hypothetical protein
MLRYQDFVPKMHKAPAVGMFGGISMGLFETFDAAVQAAGAWIKDHRIDVIQIETVVLSGLAGGSLSSQPAGLAVPPLQGSALFWHQFIRVWYDDEVQRHPYR